MKADNTDLSTLQSSCEFPMREYRGNQLKPQKRKVGIMFIKLTRWDPASGPHWRQEAMEGSGFGLMWEEVRRGPENRVVSGTGEHWDWDDWGSGVLEGIPLPCDERQGAQDATAKLLAWARKDVCVLNTKTVSGPIDISQMIKDLEASPTALERPLTVPHITDDAEMEIALGDGEQKSMSSHLED